jgi:hypothetical protein
MGCHALLFFTYLRRFLRYLGRGKINSKSSTFKSAALQILPEVAKISSPV